MAIAVQPMRTCSTDSHAQGATVSVWKVPLDIDRFDSAAVSACLTDVECHVSNQYRAEHVHNNFRLTRAAVRTLISEQAGVAPSDIVIDQNAFGKPFVAPGTPGSHLRFNVSHSGTFSLIALAHGRSLGVDIEKVRGNLAIDDVAARVFSSMELAAIRSYSGPYRTAAFFDIWVRKEAYVKATGEGFSHGLRQACVLSDSAVLNGFTIAALPVEVGYTAALAAEGSGWRSEILEFDPGRLVSRCT